MKKKIYVLLTLLLFGILCTIGCANSSAGKTEGQDKDKIMEVAQCLDVIFSKQPDKTILTSINVEVGTKELETKDFFSIYTGQHFEQEEVLDEKQLSTVGSNYSIRVCSDGMFYKVKVSIVDTTAPVITGAKDQAIYEGKSVSYKKGVEVNDNSGEEIELVIDKSKVDTNKVGTYPIYYSATDSSGNTVQVETTLTVKEKIIINEAYVRPMVEKIVKKVTNSSMSTWDKAYALYKWCANNIYYGSRGDRTSIWTGAYEGIHDRSGDCFTYYATYAAMLEVAGIPHMKVSRVGGTSNHWWNLVNVGNGWYHCDSSPRRIGDSYICFMQTDAQVAAYTESYPEKPNYYTFDVNKYPERATTIVYGK